MYYFKRCSFRNDEVLAFPRRFQNNSLIFSILLYRKNHNRFFAIPCSVRLCTGCMVWDIRHSRFSRIISNSATGSRGKTPPPWRADWCRLRPSPTPFQRKSECLISQHPHPVHSRTEPPSKNAPTLIKTLYIPISRSIIKP